MNNYLQPTSIEQEFFHGPDMSRFIGIPLRTLHRYLAEGRIPSYKLGRHRLYRKSEVLAAMESLRTASVSEVLK